MGVKGMYSKNDEFKKSVGLLFYYSKVSLRFRGHIKIQILFIPIMPTIYSIKNKNVWPLFDLPYSIQPEDEIYGSAVLWIQIHSDLDPGCCPNLDPDPYPGLYSMHYPFWKKKIKIILEKKNSFEKRIFFNNYKNKMSPTEICLLSWDSE